MKNIEVLQLPADLEDGAIYTMRPVAPDEGYYKARTDRHEGLLSLEEQEFIKNKTVGIAGLGGMGGPLAPVMLRLGVGTLKLADNDVFDATNINRQFGATRFTIGKSKTFETAKAMRAITDDSTLVLYPRGINEEEVDHFLDGCDLVVDALDFMAVGARVLMLKKARERKIPVINANSTGFGTRLFLFTHESMDIETFLGISLSEARELQQKLASKTATAVDKARIMHAMIMNFTPSPPIYADEKQAAGNVKALRKRMIEQQRGPSVIATNLPFATGFVANRALLYLLKNSSVQRKKARELPVVPSYIYLDSATLKLKVRHRGFVENIRRFVLKMLLKRSKLSQ